MNRINLLPLCPMMALATVILFGCSTGGDRGYSITGTVTDSITGLSLDSALLYLNDTLYETIFASDSTGKYSVANFGHPPVTIICRHDGYLTKSRVVHLEPLRSPYRNYPNVNFRLVPQ